MPPHPQGMASCLELGSRVGLQTEARPHREQSPNHLGCCKDFGSESGGEAMEGFLSQAFQSHSIRIPDCRGSN